MKLYLLRHGEAMTKYENPERPLNNSGVNEITRISRYLKAQKIHFSVIYHSELLRSKETASMIAQALELNDSLQLNTALSADENIQQLIKAVELIPDNALLVGHLPNIALLSNYLLNYDINVPSVAFSTGTLACLESQDGHVWHVESIIDPSQLQN